MCVGDGCSVVARMCQRGCAIVRLGLLGSGDYEAKPHSQEWLCHGVGRRGKPRPGRVATGLSFRRKWRGAAALYMDYASTRSADFAVAAGGGGTFTSGSGVSRFAYFVAM